MVDEDSFAAPLPSGGWEDLKEFDPPGTWDDDFDDDDDDDEPSYKASKKPVNKPSKSYGKPLTKAEKEAWAKSPHNPAGKKQTDWPDKYWS